MDSSLAVRLDQGSDGVDDDVRTLYLNEVGGFWNDRQPGPGDGLGELRVSRPPRRPRSIIVGGVRLGCSQYHHWLLRQRGCSVELLEGCVQIMSLRRVARNLGHWSHEPRLELLLPLLWCHYLFESWQRRV